jgi:hypothetical protein
MPGGRGLVLFQMVLSIALVGVVLLGFELALRLVDPLHGSPGVAMYHPTRGDQLVPGFRGFWQAPVYVNALGFRDYDRAQATTVAKPPGMTRVMMFGDSFTYGGQWAIEAAFSYQTERALEAQEPSKRWEVINAGVPGYSTYQEGVYIRETVPSYTPDFVVLEFTLNDIIGWDFVAPPDTGLKRYARPVLDWLRRNSYIYHWVYSNFAVAGFGATPRAAKPFALSAGAPGLLGQRSPQRPAVEPPARFVAQGPGQTASDGFYAPFHAGWYTYYAPHFADEAPSYRAIRQHLRDVDAYLTEQKIPHIFMIYPDMQPLVDYDAPLAINTSASVPYGAVYSLGPIHAQIRAAMSDTHAYVLDLLDVFAPLPHSEIYEGTSHPGPSPNKYVAEALATCIRGILDGTIAPAIPDQPGRCPTASR